MIAGLLGFIAAVSVGAVGFAFVAWVKRAADWEARVIFVMMKRLTEAFAQTSLACIAATDAAKKFAEAWNATEPGL